MNRRIVLYTVVVLVMLVGNILARYQTQKLSNSRIRRQKLSYVAKFHYKNGGKIHFDVKLERMRNNDGAALGIQIALYKQSQYERLMKSNGSCQEKLNLAFRLDSLNIHLDGTPWYKTYYIEPTVNLETYYIFAADCDAHLVRLTSRDNLLFSFELTSDSSGHFHEGEQYILSTHVFFGLLSSLCFLPFAKRFITEVKKGIYDMNYAFMVVNLVLFLKIIGIAIEVFELVGVKYSGHGSDVLSFLAQLCSYFVQYFLCCILIFLAAGWTITFDDVLQFELFLPISVLIGLVKFFILLIAKVLQGEANMHHRYSGWIGAVISLFQLALYGYFFKEIYYSIKEAGLKKVKSFMLNLGILGTLYFLSFPITLIIACFIVPASQFQFVESMRLIAEFITIYYLVYITTTEKGVYRSISFKSMAFSLPK